MAQSTFKIGESCIGGIITAEVKGKNVTVINKDWDFSKGSNKGSDQSGAKELSRIEVNTDNGDDAFRTIDNYLNQLTTCYYAEQVMVWIQSKANIKTPMFW
jgi:hypothetical protein